MCVNIYNLKMILDSIEQLGGIYMVTADHGNAEHMVKRNKKRQVGDKDGEVQIQTSHTSQPLSHYKYTCTQRRSTYPQNVSQVHIFNERFREKIGDIEGARAAFQLCDTESHSCFIETAINEAIWKLVLYTIMSNFVIVVRFVLKLMFIINRKCGYSSGNI